MKSLVPTGFLVGAVLFGTSAVSSQAPEEAGVEVQARGPIHEAFAQPVEAKPAPGTLVPKAPPEPIPEAAPEQKPAGDNVQWIGGYWAWDADRNDFMWVSGVYRNTPDGMRYVAGYWEFTPDGWRWVPGFWAPAQAVEIPYVPQPPAPLDYGPSLPAPGADYFYSPGCWVYRDTRWLWRPGFWRQHRPGFCWVAPRYCWTPGGYAFIDGYWDHPFHSRGLLFAPVCFNRPLWQTPGWFYRPGYAVNIGLAFDNLFVNVGFGRYHFGNYYGDRYARAGFRPWFDHGVRQYDPLYAHARWQNRGNPDWQAGLRRTFDDRVAGRGPLPPRTLQEQNLLAAQEVKNPKFAGANVRNVVAPLDKVKEGNVKLVTSTPAQLAKQQAAAKEIQELGQERRRLEAALAKGAPAKIGPKQTGPKQTGPAASAPTQTGPPQALRLPPAAESPPKQTASPPNVKNPPPTSLKPEPSPAPKNVPQPKRADGPPPRVVDDPPKTSPPPKRSDNPPPRIVEDPPKAAPQPKRSEGPPPRVADNPPKSSPPPKRADNPPPRIVEDPPRAAPQPPQPKRSEGPPPRIADDPPKSSPPPKRADNPPPRIVDDRPPPKRAEEPARRDDRPAPRPQADTRPAPAPRQVAPPPPPPRSSPPPARSGGSGGGGRSAKGKGR